MPQSLLALAGALTLAFVFAATSVEAKPRHTVMSHHDKQAGKHVRIAKVKKIKKVKRVKAQAPSPAKYAPFGFPGSLVSRMERDLGTNPTGWARVWCGQYLGMIAQSLGMTPPAGFPLATAWARFGVPAAPAPGVVAVMKHHVGVVRRVIDRDRVEIISGNHNRRVGIGVYPARLVIAWRAPQ